MKKSWILVGLACALTLAGCGGGEEKKEVAKAPETPAAAPAAAVDDASAATITGKVKFEGTPSAPKNLDMSATPACAKAHTSPAKTEDVVAASDGSLKYAFVYVKSGLPDKTWPVPATSVTLDQKGCMYQPHVIGVMTGQNIEVKNSDPTNHNIHPLPKTNQEWNESQPPGSEPKMKSFPREEIAIPVKCNIHPWMRSYISVLPHPFHAVTADDGTFTIKGLPPGTYTVTVWHEKYGSVDQQVTVGAKESKSVDFALKG
jgi:hypothetical protein